MKKGNLNKALWGFLSLILLGACAKPSAHRQVASMRMDVGVIGGKPTQENLSFDDQILYLAMGVSFSKNDQGKVHAKWTGHCTASAIAPRIILTAAHCLVDRKPDSIRIVLTKNPSDTALKPADWFEAQEIRIHENYSGTKGFLNDVALILLTRDVPESKILKIANADETYLPMTMMVAGYGTSSESADEKVQEASSNGLNYVEKIVEDFDPDKLTFHINQNDHKGFCSGDSGGPGLMLDPATEEFKIIGVVSNVSMKTEQRKMMDPEGRFNLCIGEGNYTNILNADIRAWIDKNQSELLKE